MGVRKGNSVPYNPTNRVLARSMKAHLRKKCKQSSSSRSSCPHRKPASASNSKNNRHSSPGSKKQLPLTAKLCLDKDWLHYEKKRAYNPTYFDKRPPQPLESHEGDEKEHLCSSSCNSIAASPDAYDEHSTQEWEQNSENVESEYNDDDGFVYIPDNLPPLPLKHGRNGKNKSTYYRPSHVAPVSTGMSKEVAHPRHDFGDTPSPDTQPIHMNVISSSVEIEASSGGVLIDLTEDSTCAVPDIICVSNDNEPKQQCGAVDVANDSKRYEPFTYSEGRRRRRKDSEGVMSAAKKDSSSDSEIHDDTDVLSTNVQARVHTRKQPMIKRGQKRGQKRDIQVDVEIKHKIERRLHVGIGDDIATDCVIVERENWGHTKSMTREIKRNSAKTSDKMGSHSNYTRTYASTQNDRFVKTDVKHELESEFEVELEYEYCAVDNREL